MTDSIDRKLSPEEDIYRELEVGIYAINRRKNSIDVGEYRANYADVAAAERASVISDPFIHYSLYGVHQGRDYLDRLERGVSNIILISPSHLKQCGIGEYGRYLSDTFAATGRKVTVVRTSSEVLALDDALLSGALILVNHGPGLFDGLNPRLSQGESTTQLMQNLETLAFAKGAVPVILHHSLIDTDQHLLYSRQSQIWNSRIAQITFISAGAWHFFLIPAELGVSPVSSPHDVYDHDRVDRTEILGFFGFFQYGGKDFDALIHAAKELRATLVGSVATVNQTEVEKLEEILDNSGIEHDFATGWCDDSELMERLSVADYFYLPQKDYDHWNNSATARFVANFDRPIFLPPHQPFLDMADGAIFATKWDLPRIIAAVREPRVFAEASARVAAFRGRAAMKNTANLIGEQLKDQLVHVGEELLLGAAETSLERYLELPQPKQERLLAQLGAGADELLHRVRAFPRVSPPLQFWRKHYELGDLLGVPTLFDAVHTTWLSVCKRYPNFDTLRAALPKSASSKLEGPMESAVKGMIVDALKSRGATFHSPTIVFLRNGELDDDALAADKLTSFLRERGRRMSQMRALLDFATLSDSLPTVDNLFELLVVPPDALVERRAPFDLRRIDLEWVHKAPHPQERFNRLIAAANEAGIHLSRSIVLDHLVPKKIQPRVLRYCVEDFIYLDGDFLILHAVRCILKRDSYPIELMVLQKLAESGGKEALLKYLVMKSGGLIKIAGLDEEKPQRLKMEEFSLFMSNARDPLFGLFDPRNEYELQRRHNERWWIATKAGADACWTDSGSNFRSILDTYRLLDVPLDVDAKELRSFISDFMTADGGISDLVHLSRTKARMVPGVPLNINRTASKETLAALHGFHPAEEPGAWIDGRTGQVALWLAAGPRGQPGKQALALSLGLFGSTQLGPRTLSVHVRLGTATVEQKIPVTTEDGMEVRIPIPPVETDTLLVIDLEISDVISPQAAGVSADPRRLGILLRRVSVEPFEDGRGQSKPNAHTGFFKSLIDIFR